LAIKRLAFPMRWRYVMNMYVMNICLPCREA
jgi:hypothetical protein